MIERKLGLKKGKGIFLAYDHGLEHGPRDMVGLAHDPHYIATLAYKGGVNAVIMQYGTAKRVNPFLKEKRINLILKINGKTLLTKEKYIAGLTAQVEDAVKLGAKAIGYTIYFGSPYEHLMIETFSSLRKKAEHYGLGVVLWSYVRAPHIKDEQKKEYVGYAVRAGYELGADIVKVKYTGSMKTFKEALSYTPHGNGFYVYVAGGSKSSRFLKDVKDMREAGASGLAVGRNVWMRENALEVLKEIKKVFEL
ncbi:MAG: hypothetical protein GXN99_01315 [Candidatus Nanohaloarchaeota archaeon]|nr:hypothetical protein [Candidatus Nanohaloarchaeota archaeon]